MNDSDFNSYITTDNELAICGISFIHEICNDWEGGRRCEKEDGEDCEPGPVPSFNELHNAYKTVRSFLYVHSTGEYDEKNILNVAVTLFPFQHKVSTKMFASYGFLWEKGICKPIFAYYFCMPTKKNV